MCDRFKRRSVAVVADFNVVKDDEVMYDVATMIQFIHTPCSVPTVKVPADNMSSTGSGL